MQALFVLAVAVCALLGLLNLKPSACCAESVEKVAHGGVEARHRGLVRLSTAAPRRASLSGARGDVVSGARANLLTATRSVICVADSPVSCVKLARAPSSDIPCMVMRSSIHPKPIGCGLWYNVAFEIM